MKWEEGGGGRRRGEEALDSEPRTSEGVVVSSAVDGPSILQRRGRKENSAKDGNEPAGLSQNS